MLDASTRPRPLFLLGSKRSGTSYLASLLNSHPRVFVSNESDVIWLLYQHAKGLAPRCYDWDGPLGMQATLNACRRLFVGNDIRRLYFQIQQHLMCHGSELQTATTKDDLLWIGDKKPVQHADPTLHDFILEHLPDARFIHLVRHPRAVVGSMMAARSWTAVEYWHRTPQELLERWVLHEQWVEKVAQDSAVLDLRFEDLVSCKSAMSALFGFLDLDLPCAPLACRTDWNEKYEGLQLSFGPEARRLLERFGYA